MKNKFIENLYSLGLVSSISDGLEEHLNTGSRGVYVGFDPTAPSLHVGNLLAILNLVRFANAGHKPYALIGGATGMIGDPSGKKDERKLLSKEDVLANSKKIADQIMLVYNNVLKFYELNPKHELTIVNNADWMGELNTLEFLRDIGKHITVNYMLAKDSVKNRIDSGISFTEFAYQLIQAYDFCYLNKTHNITVQLGGSDQWGNITTGIELGRKMAGNALYGLTSPLLTKSDGTKFGKSETGTVWIDFNMNSVNDYYQFWYKQPSDIILDLLKKFIPVKHDESLIKGAVDLAHIMTIILIDQDKSDMMDQFFKAVNYPRIIEEFDKCENLYAYDIKDYIENNKVPSFLIDRNILLSDAIYQKGNELGFFKSKGEFRRFLQNKALKVNGTVFTTTDELNLCQPHSSDYHLIKFGKNKLMVLYMKPESLFIEK